jgi:uncharacterized protein (TIGR02271 family)
VIPDDETLRIPAVQEALSVGRRTVETGRVRIRKEIATRTVQVEAPLVQERVVIERVPIDREVDRDAPPAVREENGVLVVPVLEEVLVVERRLVLKEELRVTRLREESRVVQDVALAEERVIVERVDPEGSVSAGAEVGTIARAEGGTIDQR